jgi:hypothetical protein
VTGWYVLAGLAVLYVIVLIAERRVRTSAVKSLVRDFTRMRAALVTDIVRTPASADHPILARLNAQYDAITGVFTSRGFRVLGDVEERLGDGTSAGISRWLVDADGTTAGWIAVLETAKGTKHAASFLTEFASPHYVMTNWGAWVVLVHPPTIERTCIVGSEPATKVAEAHRTAVVRHGAAVATEVGTIDDAIAMMERARQHTNAWRASRPAHVLLEEDLRATLGKHYDQFGPAVASAIN